MDFTVLIILALPIALFMSSVAWTNLSNNSIALEHREQVRQVRERVLTERLERQRQRENYQNENNENNSRESSTTQRRPVSTPDQVHQPKPSAPPSSAASDSSSDSSDNSRDCPICLSPPTFCVETNCGHVYCTDCILEYYNRGNSNVLPQAVVCPCCRRRVDSLVTKFNSEEENSAPAREKLTAIRDYNRRHSGEPRSFNERIADTPHLLRRLATEATRSPGSAMRFLFQSHFLLSFIGTALYVLSPFDLLPELAFGALGFVDDAIILVGFCVVAASIYRTFSLGRQQQAAI